MGYDFLTILETCGIAGFAFLFLGLVSLLLGVRKARPEFRTKGYLRAPSGRAWLPFLLWKQYELFEDSRIRFYFGTAHFCLLAMVVLLTAILVLLGSEVLLKRM